MELWRDSLADSLKRNTARMSAHTSIVALLQSHWRSPHIHVSFLFCVYLGVLFWQDVNTALSCSRGAPEEAVTERWKEHCVWACFVCVFTLPVLLDICICIFKESLRGSMHRQRLLRSLAPVVLYFFFFSFFFLHLCLFLEFHVYKGHSCAPA